MSGFTDQLLAGLGPNMRLHTEVITLIRWLEEDQGNLKHYTSTNQPFLPTLPVSDIADLWSHLAFVINPDMFLHWLGRNDLGDRLVSILRCGADGSHIGLWRDPNDVMRYVFAGSEGEAFVIAQTGLDFIGLVTMGYARVEMRADLGVTPSKLWSEVEDRPWPEPKSVKAWVRETFQIDYPETGAAFLACDEGADPFQTWINENTAY